MTEIVFQVEEGPDGGFTARAVGASIFTEADTVEALHANIREAVTCHFDDPKERPTTVRLRIVRQEVIGL